MIKILSKILDSNPIVMVGIIGLLIIIFIIRKMKKGLINNASQRIYKRLLKHPEQIAAFCDEIGVTYFTRLYDHLNIRDLKSRIVNRQVGKFIIMDCLETANHILLYTKCIDRQSGIKWDGEPGEVENNHYYFFAITDYPEEKKLLVSGEYYEGNNDKYIKTEFARQLAEEI